jgi:hypothetical protein
MTTPLKRTLRDATDKLDLVAKLYPMKALALDLHGHDTPRAESTLRAELNGQPGYKLGGSTFVAIMALASQHPDHRVRDLALSPLDAIEAHFNRVAYRIPEGVPEGDPIPVMAHLGRLSSEFSEAIGAAADAMADGRIDAAEVARCRKELADLITTAIRFQAMLDHLPVAAGRLLRRAK